MDQVDRLTVQAKIAREIQMKKVVLMQEAIKHATGFDLKNFKMTDEIRKQFIMKVSETGVEHFCHGDTVLIEFEKVEFKIGKTKVKYNFKYNEVWKDK